jgi:hypothetical protein
MTVVYIIIMTRAYHRQRALDSYKRYKHMKSILNRSPWLVHYGGAAHQEYKTRITNALAVARHHHQLYRSFP